MLGLKMIHFITKGPRIFNNLGLPFDKRYDIEHNHFV